jgi:hypothetical protein
MSMHGVKTKGQTILFESINDSCLLIQFADATLKKEMKSLALYYLKWGVAKRNYENDCRFARGCAVRYMYINRSSMFYFSWFINAQFNNNYSYLVIYIDAKV